MMASFRSLLGEGCDGDLLAFATHGMTRLLVLALPTMDQISVEFNNWLFAKLQPVCVFYQLISTPLLEHM